MAGPVEKRLEDLGSELFMPRELSWMSFNARVLQEAEDPTVPSIQRLRFLGIFSNNLDEFFRVRVAEVRRLISVSKSADRDRYKALLEDIQLGVVELQGKFDKVYSEVLRELARRRIYIINEMQLVEKQAEFVRQYFRRNILPELEPILLAENRDITGLTDELIYLAVDIRSGSDYHYALVEVPTDSLDRFVQIPKRKKRRRQGVYRAGKHHAVLHAGGVPWSHPGG